MERTSETVKTPLSDSFPWVHDPQRDTFQALVLAQVSNLLVVEQHVIRRVRLLTRASAALVSGSGVFYQYVRNQQLLIPMAIIADATQPPDTFTAGVSGIITVPQVRPLRFGEGVAGYAAEYRETIVIDTRRPHSRFMPTTIAVDAEIFGVYPQILICIPCFHANELIGVLAVAQITNTAPLGDHTLDFLQGIVGQLSLVLAQDHLARSPDDHHRMQQIQEDERKRLARDLHDGPAQSISNAVMSLEYIDRILGEHSDEARIELRRLHARLSHTMRELRTVMFSLRPLALESEGLEVALRHLGDQYGDGALHIQVHCHLHSRLPESLETGIYIIIREAVQNVYKHAEATQCFVEVSQDNQHLSVSIRDSGKGFDYDRVLQSYPHGHSWGLVNMYERARLLNATIAIHTSIGQGTLIELRFTLP